VGELIKLALLNGLPNERLTIECVFPGFSQGFPPNLVTAAISHLEFSPSQNAQFPSAWPNPAENPRHCTCAIWLANFIKMQTYAFRNFHCALVCVCVCWPTLVDIHTRTAIHL